MNSSDAVIIGAGLGGLSAAISLASEHLSVTLFEQNQSVGGKAGSKQIGGYRFDTGPSLLTMVHVFERLFNRAGKQLCDYIDVVPLSPLTRYWFPDGTTLASDGYEPFFQTLTDSLEVTREELEAYKTYCSGIYDLTHRVFLERPLHRISSYLHLDTVKALLHIHQVDLLRTMHKANRTCFSDERMVQLLDRYATYNGSNPYLAPGTLNNIFHVEHGLGGFGVSNGIFGIPEGMKSLAQELGVDIRTGVKVEEISYDRKRRVRGVKTSSGEHAASRIISDIDVLTLYRDLLDDEKAPLARRYRRLPPSSSALVFYWGVSTTFSELGIHNIFFSSDYQREFSQIHADHQLPGDPTVYINITSKLSQQDAPSGCENWFVLVNAPFNDGRDWADEIQRTRSAVIRKLSAVLGSDLEHLIEEEQILSPADIESETGSFRGSLYGISSNNRMAAFLRHRNDSKRYPGLYLCGGSVHPGGGMPLSVLSGMIAADLLVAEIAGR
jgi:phytoene desaturase